MAVIASRLKRAELASSVGAGLLGAGLGAMAARYVGDLALYVLAAGALVHGWGMYNKRVIERNRGQPEAAWMKMLYWLCWVVLAGLAALLAFNVFFSIAAKTD